MQVKQLKQIAEQEKVRQAERNLSRREYREILKEIDKERTTNPAMIKVVKEVLNSKKAIPVKKEETDIKLIHPFQSNFRNNPPAFTFRGISYFNFSLSATSTGFLLH